MFGCPCSLVCEALDYIKYLPLPVCPADTYHIQRIGLYVSIQINEYIIISLLYAVIALSLLITVVCLLEAIVLYTSNLLGSTAAIAAGWEFVYSSFDWF